MGDLLIWRTILAIGQQSSRHLVFVSGEEKTDWRYQSENRALYPSFELLDEYRIASNGKSLLIASFAQILEHFGVPAPVVAEVRQEEAVASSTSDPSPRKRLRPLRATEAKNAVLRWVTRQHPGSLVDRNTKSSYPDIIVINEDHIGGYEVKYLAQIESASRRLRDAVFLAGQSEIPVNLVSCPG